MGDDHGHGEVVHQAPWVTILTLAISFFVIAALLLLKMV